MLSQNEWDPLKHVIVGVASGARVPDMDLSLRTINYSNLQSVDSVPRGLYPATVIEQANEDLDQLCEFLLGAGVRVSRPDLTVDPEYYYYCPRDSVLVLEDLIIESPMPLRARARESHSMHKIFRDLDQDFAWIKLDTPRRDSLYNLAAVNDPDTLALTNTEASFDAANILRANDDLFYLVSNSGNLRGAQLLDQITRDHVRVWPITGVYSYMHIDSTIMLLREGLMLLNPSRINSVEQLPPPLRSWDIVWAPDPGDKWHYPGYCNSSKWVTMNVLSISPDVVLVEQGQEELARRLNQAGLETVLLPMRHSRTLGGSFHCCTLDLERHA